jgi:hypothetical protein
MTLDHPFKAARTSTGSRVMLSVVGGIAIALAMAAQPALAGTPASETFVLLRSADGSEFGWSASGQFSDAGGWTSDFRRFGALPSPVAFQTLLKTTETGLAGTFDLAFQGHFNAPAGHDFGGTWSVGGGTGSYATLHGTGTWTVAVDLNTGIRTFTLSGDVHLD